MWGFHMLFIMPKAQSPMPNAQYATLANFLLFEPVKFHVILYIVLYGFPSL